jgi:segregation and condensation protein A
MPTLCEVLGSAVTESPDFDAGAAAYRVALPTFEGPLDLLLHLCQKHELDILEIPISFVTQKYLEYLKLMTLANLDVAAEYLVMAATLAHIKSKMLLPQVPSGQEDDALEEEDPREALIRRLLEYQKYKKAAEDLAAKGIKGADYFGRGASIEQAAPIGLPPLADVSLFALMDAFQRVLSRSKIKITHDVIADRISINDRIHELVDLLKDKKRLLFDELFAGAVTRFDLVITFLALLEMTKLRMTRLFQTGPMEQLYVEVGEAELRGLNADDVTIDSGPPKSAAAEQTHEANPEQTHEASPAEQTHEASPAEQTHEASSARDVDPELEASEEAPSDLGAQQGTRTAEDAAEHEETPS